ncbi:O-antigen ligase family protein [Aliiruegeria lutimaris]|uniref:O-antigen ligase n=1 Tax=Aliiruegeria lutimaris TaxID=571298 RepID=A0A1G9Q096_9RHOB|nr:O-antigen ligase family protein [Aliiruegeria lutimaris]SDM04492.1 O-antigen ligase [Aliiruegeria lutimaris]
MTRLVPAQVRGQGRSSTGRTRRDFFGLREAGAANASGTLAALAVGLSPMNYLRFDAIYVTASDVAMIMAFVVALATSRISLNFFGPGTSLWLISVLLFCGGLILGSLVNGDPLDLARVFSQYFFSLVLLPVVLAGRSHAQVVALLKVLLASMVFVNLFGIYVVHFIDEPSLRLVSGNGRLLSLVERANECAALSAIAMVLLLGLHLMGRLRARWVVLGLPILFYGVLLTGSNSGLLTSILGIGAIVLFCGTARHIVAALLLVVGAAKVSFEYGAYFLPAVFQERVFGAIVSGSAAEAGTFVGRAHLNEEALQVARDTLIFGLGADQYREASMHQNPVHNAFLLALTEGGILSLMGLVGLLLTGVFLAMQAMRMRHSQKDGILTLVALLIFTLMLNMLPFFYGRFFNVPLVLFMALSASRLSEANASLKAVPSHLESSGIPFGIDA